jgi:hypothetical protein
MLRSPFKPLSPRGPAPQFEKHWFRVLLVLGLQSGSFLMWIILLVQCSQRFEAAFFFYLQHPGDEQHCSYPYGAETREENQNVVPYKNAICL